MKRAEVLREFIKGEDIEDVRICINLKGSTEAAYYSASTLLLIYDYLDQDLAGSSDSKSELCEPKDKPRKPKTKTARSSTPAKKVTAGGGKRRTVDAGKLIALYKAGWHPEKIADELGCHVTTVYNYLRQCKDEGKI